MTFGLSALPGSSYSNRGPKTEFVSLRGAAVSIGTFGRRAIARGVVHLAVAP